MNNNLSNADTNSPEDDTEEDLTCCPDLRISTRNLLASHRTDWDWAMSVWLQSVCYLEALMSPRSPIMKLSVETIAKVEGCVERETWFLQRAGNMDYSQAPKRPKNQRKPYGYLTLIATQRAVTCETGLDMWQKSQVWQKFSRRKPVSVISRYVPLFVGTHLSDL